jgi:Lar family restriction alleviation protein
MSDTIQSAELLPCPFCGNTEVHIESDSIGSSITCYKCGVGTIERNWTEKAAIRIWNTRAAHIALARDAAIRADEARKQAERYAAFIETLKKYIGVCEPVEGKTLDDIYKPESSGCIFCSNNKVCNYLTRSALADLEAPK